LPRNVNRPATVSPYGRPTRAGSDHPTNGGGVGLAATGGPVGEATNRPAGPSPAQPASATAARVGTAAPAARRRTAALVGVTSRTVRHAAHAGRARVRRVGGHRPTGVGRGGRAGPAAGRAARG